MRILAALAALALATPAVAGNLTIEKKGLMGAHVWVDGQSIGKVKKKGLVHPLSDGPHEVWVAAENSGVITRCHGMVEGAGSSISIRDRGCEGLVEGYGDPTFFKGATVNFSVDGELQAWVSIDAGQKFAFPNGPFKLNLRPGQHTIVLYNDVMSESVFDQGTVTLEKNSFISVTCTTAGCVGFDQPPTIIQVFEQAPSSSGINIDVNLPGISVDIDVNGDGGGGASSAPAARPAAGGGGSSNQSCCINNAYYDCPDADAVYTCSGAFMACMMDCGMMDMDCPQKCEQTHPLDPSKCSRNPSQDNSCKN